MQVLDFVIPALGLVVGIGINPLLARLNNALAERVAPYVPEIFRKSTANSPTTSRRLSGSPLSPQLTFLSASLKVAADKQKSEKA